MLCLDIKVENKRNNYLYKIFKSIDLLKYNWHIVYEEIYFNEDHRTVEGIFQKEILSGEEFLKAILRPEYYMIFADIKAFHKDAAIKEIKNISDFIEGKCEIVFLCTDTTFIEFYSKDEKILEAVFNNCEGKDFVEKKYRSKLEVNERNLIAW